MKLVYMYGPPGVGKYTTAIQLSKITGYKIFHNHLTVNMVRSIFDRGTPKYNELVTKYRIEIIEEAKKAGINGIIFTSAHVKSFGKEQERKDEGLRRMWIMMRRKGIKIYFVHLVCDKKVLFKRIKADFRKHMDKIVKASTLRRELKTTDFYQDLSFGKSLRIDNTHLSAKKVAMQIKKYYKL